LLSYTSPEWVFVDASKTSDHVKLVEGSASLVHTADEDLPESHTSYDLDFDISPDALYTGLLSGDPNANPDAQGHPQGNGNYARDADFAKLHVEWESGAVPSFVWPTEGDRIKLWGQWAWDCGHWGQGITTNQSDPQGSLIGTGDYFLPGQIEGSSPSRLRGEQTELHPMQGLIVTRKASWSSPTAATETDAFISSDGTHAYAEERCSAGLSPGAGLPGPAPVGGLPAFGPDFSACVNNPANQHQDIHGRSYEFLVPAPPRPAPDAQLTLREQPVVSAAGFTEQQTQTPDGVLVKVAAPALDDGATHAFGARYYVGWQMPDASPAGPAPAHLRVTIKSILVNHSLAEPNSNHPTVAGLPGIGRYNLYLDANGYWNFLGGRAPEPNDTSWVPGLGMVQDGQSFPVDREIDFFVPPGAPVRLDVSGRECDLPRMDPCLGTPEVADGNDHPGEAIVHFASADAALGDHTLAPDVPSRVDHNYVISYSIRRIADPPGAVGQASVPGSTGVPSSSPGGTLGGGGRVLDPQSGPLAGCAATRPPRSRIYRGAPSSTRRIRLRGTALSGRCGGGVASVRVAVARLAGHRCRFVLASGDLGPPGRCGSAYYRLAAGTTRWRVSLRGRFSRGRYLVLTRATDRLGHVELARATGNTTRFTIR
ncbi:MAG TPA: hypothetical protein VGN69_03835, partial [Solirubrobacteraceae bacterium]|nr:hypothetical protein [Solirubrobacteraceae bacterium]